MATKKKSKSLAAIDEILNGSFKHSGDWSKFTAQQQAKLQAAGVNSRVGIILHAGRVKDGTFQVQFNSGSDGWSSRWPEWAYEPARESLLHGKQVWVIYEGDSPIGDNLLQVLIYHG